MQNAPIEHGILEIQYDRTANAGFTFLTESEYFGVLQLHVKKCRVTENPLFFVFTVDKSGSMNSEDHENSKKTTKMEYVKETFMQLIRYFVDKPDSRIIIAVNTFNNDVECIIEPTELNKSTMDAVIGKINHITPEDSTDIGKALIHSNRMIRDYQDENPEHQVIHIFMSDGDPTVGVRSTTELVNVAKNTSCPNIFIGFGKQHNSRLLRKLSDATRGDYQVVDNFEHTTAIFGQVIHPFLYPVLRTPRLRILDGVIYDWRSGKWVTEISERMYSAEENKIYQMKTENPQKVQVFLYDGDSESDCEAELFETIALPELIRDFACIDNESPDGFDLRPYMFRQETQQLLHRVVSYVPKNCKMAVFDDGIKELRRELRNLFRNIRDYMKTEDRMTDIFLITLCDDISISYNTIYTQDGAMYSSARQTSQGRQQTVSVTPTRMPVNHYTDSDSDSDSDEDNEKRGRNRLSLYLPSGEDSTCFSTPTLMKTLRSLSGTNEPDSMEL
jgi:Mg-chelatase subunit ChlD